MTTGFQEQKEGPGTRRTPSLLTALVGRGAARRSRGFSPLCEQGSYSRALWEVQPAALILVVYEIEQ